MASPLIPEGTAAYFNHESKRLLLLATEKADRGRYRQAQTLLELSEAHAEHASHASLETELAQLG
jgi:hypothetical protein